MLNPPITGIPELDSYLYSLHINSNDSTTTSYSSDPATGIVKDNNGNVVAYLYEFMHVKYADDNTGTNISDVCTSKSYYGLHNSTSSTESTNPADYTWYLATSGFGTTRFLFYYNLGGRTIKFDVNTAAIDYHWLPAPITAIDLDMLVAAGTITSNEIMNAAINATKLNVAALDQYTGQLVPNAVTAETIAANAVTELKLAANAVTAAKTSIAALNSTTGNLNNNTVGSLQIAANAVTAAKTSIAAIDATSGNLNANTVTAGSIVAGTITGDKIYAGSITGDKISANTLTANNIVGGTITGDKISATTITGANIAALTIGAGQIAASAITAVKIEAGTITADKIASGSVWTNNLQVGSGSPTVSGTSMTGSGAVINSTGTFALGNSTGNITYNGSALTLNGQIVAMGNITGGTITSAAGFGTGTITIGSTSNLIQVSRTGSTTTPAVYINDTASAATEALYIVTNSTHTPAANTISSSASGNVALYVESTGSSSGSAKFYNTNASKNAWLAPGLYSVYSPSGGGQIKITDGTAPFTGVHEGMMPLNASYEVGDILIDDSIFFKLDVTNCLFSVKQSTQPKEVAIGVFNSSTTVQETNPTVLWETYTYMAPDPTDESKEIEKQSLRLLPQFNLADLQASYTVASINAVGEGQINVCGENGNIKPGDLIITSSLQGKGMKQDDDILHSYTVAKSRETATFTNPTDVKMISCVYVSG